MQKNFREAVELAGDSHISVSAAAISCHSGVCAAVYRHRRKRGKEINEPMKRVGTRFPLSTLTLPVIQGFDPILRSPNNCHCARSFLTRRNRSQRRVWTPLFCSFAFPYTFLLKSEFRLEFLLARDVSQKLGCIISLFE